MIMSYLHDIKNYDIMQHIRNIYEILGISDPNGVVGYRSVLDAINNKSTIWLGTKAKHDEAVGNGTLPENAICLITDDFYDPNTPITSMVDSLLVKVPALQILVDDLYTRLGNNTSIASTEDYDITVATVDPITVNSDYPTIGNSDATSIIIAKLVKIVAILKTKVNDILTRYPKGTASVTNSDGSISLESYDFTDLESVVLPSLYESVGDLEILHRLNNSVEILQARMMELYSRYPGITVSSADGQLYISN